MNSISYLIIKSFSFLLVFDLLSFILLLNSFLLFWYQFCYPIPPLSHSCFGIGIVIQLPTNQYNSFYYDLLLHTPFPFLHVHLLIITNDLLMRLPFSLWLPPLLFFPKLCFLIKSTLFYIWCECETKWSIHSTVPFLGPFLLSLLFFCPTFLFFSFFFS